MDPSTPRRGRLVLPALILIVLTLAAFLPVLGNGFINLDDDLSVTANPAVRAGITREGIRWAFTSLGYASNWHPLTWLSHQADVSLFGLDPAGHHLTSLLLHAANVLLLLLLLARMTGARWPSFLAAALFAVHPLHVESVAWVAERKDVLSTLLGLLCLLAWLEYLRRPASGRYILALALFVLGLLAKPMLVSFPFVLLLLDYWPLGRRQRREPAGGERGSRYLPPLTEKLPFFILAAASSLVTWLAQARGGALNPLSRTDPGGRVANALVSYVRYLGKTVWPSGLVPFYPLPAHGWGWWRIAGAALILVAVSLLALRGRRPWFAAGWLWYLVTLLPVIGLVQVGEQALADRYTYLPLIGIFIMIAWGLDEPAWRVPRLRHFLAVLAGATLLACAVLTWTQVGYWKDSLTLFGRTLEVSRDNWLALTNYGLALEEAGRYPEATARLEEALALDPGWAPARNNLGLALARSGRLAEARVHFQEALRLQPGSAEARLNLANVLALQGLPAEALVQVREAVRLAPRLAMAHNNLGVYLLREGRREEARGEFREALRLDPFQEEAKANLRDALAAGP